MTSIAIKTDLRHLFGPIRDQGQRPTCLALAASDMHAAQRGKWLPLSCEYVFFHAQRRAGRPPTTGALLPAMLSALRYDGQPAESGWPYLATLPADLAHWNPPPGVAPIFRRAGEARACTIDTIIAQLDRGVAVLVLMYLSPSFYHPGRNGIIDEAPGESPDLSLCHAMAAVGHGVASASRAVLMRNSWGSGWGDNGYGWLTEKFLRPRIDELAILKEDLSVSRHPASA